MLLLVVCCGLFVVRCMMFVHAWCFSFLVLGLSFVCLLLVVGVVSFVVCCVVCVFFFVDCCGCLKRWLFRARVRVLFVVVCYLVVLVLLLV